MNNALTRSEGLGVEGETIIIRFCGILMQATIRIFLSTLGRYEEYETMQRKQMFNDSLELIQTTNTLHKQ